AKIQEKRYTVAAKTTKTQLQQEVEQSYINMNTEYERYNKIVSQVEDLTISYKAAEVKFDAGVINSVDYLLIKNKADNISINIIKRIYFTWLFIFSPAMNARKPKRHTAFVPVACSNSFKSNFKNKLGFYCSYRSEFFY